MSVTRSAAFFGVATICGHASQLIWLAAGSRAMSAATFGEVLAAQALYAVLQIVVDVGPSAVGARLAARGEITPAKRAQLIAMRIGLAAFVAPVALVLGALHISGSLEATVPFALALFFFACLNVWEPYGTGDARPWATYMFTRSAAPALVAVGYLAAGARFPAPLAGTVECAVLLMLLVVLSRLNPPDLRLAMRSHRGPWGSVVAAGAPSVIAQASVASGTLILSGARSPAAAGVFAACVRLMSGLNALNGIVATALYPRLASGGRDRTQDEPVVTAALRLIALVAVTATAVCVLLGEPIAGAFLGDDGRTSVDALILTAATVAALGNAVMFIYQLTAGGHERDMLAPCAAGAAITIILGLGATAAVDPRVDLVATALLIGMLVNMTALGLRLRRRLPYVARSVTAGMAVAVATAALAALSLISQARIPVGIVLLVVAAVIAKQLAPAVRLMRTGI